jgi:hypothetical protein
MPWACVAGSAAGSFGRLCDCCLLLLLCCVLQPWSEEAILLLLCWRLSPPGLLRLEQVGGW